MKNLFSKLLRRMQFAFSSEENIKEAFVFFCFITNLASLFYGLVSLFILHNIVGAVDCFVFALFFMLIPMLFKFNVSLRFAINLFVLGGAGSVYLNAYLHGGVNSMVITFVTVAPLLPLFIMNLRDALIWLIIVMLCNTIIWYFNLSAIPYDKATVFPLFNLLLVNGLNVLVFVISYLFYVNRLRITIEDKRKNAELEDVKSNLLEAQKHKDTFIANISHELRNPLGVIIGLTNIIERNTVNTENLKYLQSTKEAANHLLFLINDLLDISSIESGKVSVKFHNFNIHALIQNTTSFLHLRVKEKNLTYTYSISPNVPEIINNDGLRIVQIINNLLDNAVKYSNNGIIKLAVDYKENILYINVSDSGVGIAKEHLSSIFDSFYRVDYSPVISGTGLGLSIVKQIVDKLGGTIAVESVIQKGTKFSIQLPCEPVIAGGAVSDLHKDIDDILQRLNGIHILAAEDMELNKLILEKTLGAYIENFTLEFVNNGLEVIQKLEHNNYDIILMDINMPIMNGYDAVKIIREKYGNKHKIIALTANAFKHEIEFGKQAGFDDHVTKPIEINVLLNKMYALISE